MASHTGLPARSVFENVKSVAVVGVSRKKTKFGTVAFRELKKRGYEVYPVHPSIDRIDGVRCYPTLGELPSAPNLVLVTVKPELALEVVEQAAAKGVRRIWFQQGADFSSAAERAREAGLEDVNGRCILMYAEPVGGVHSFHRFLSRVFGKY